MRLLRFEHGLIAHERFVYDFSGLLIKLGVVKAKPGWERSDVEARFTCGECNTLH